MRFQPKTERELAEENLWPEGEYSFEVIAGTDKVSKQGNEMIELKLRVYNDDGGSILVNDYLLENMGKKLRHAAVACGLLAQYEAGHLEASDFVKKAGRLKLGIQKNKDDQYPDRNAVKRYVFDRPDPSAPLNTPRTDVKIDDLEDEIPWN